jgi:hypothetical protein
MLNIADPAEALDFDCALAAASEHAEAEALTAVAGAEAHPFALLLAFLAARL